MIELKRKIFTGGERRLAEAHFRLDFYLHDYILFFISIVFLGASVETSYKRTDAIFKQILILTNAKNILFLQVM